MPYVLAYTLKSDTRQDLFDMQDDTMLNLSNIHSTGITGLVGQLMEIQKHVVSREKSEAWAEKLRFVDISHISSKDQSRPKKKRRLEAITDSSSSSVKVLPVTGRWHVGNHDYIAISWRWRDNGSPLSDSSIVKYRVNQRHDVPHNSKMPDQYYDRAIHFAQAQRIRLLWIDTECIYQDCPHDQTTGIQSMDIVYRNCKYALGILTVRIHLQRHLNRLSALLSGELFNQNSAEPRFLKGVNPEAVLDVLRLVMSDERWDRTWIFQEDHCASSKMILLIPHSANLIKDPDLFGSLDGELQISCAAFRQATTSFYLACDAKGHEYEESLSFKLRQYNVMNQVYECVPSQSFASQVSEEVEDDSEYPSLLPSSLSILDDIKARQNSVVSDRIAIWANCCRYHTRLDGWSLAQAGYGLSTSYLCLYLLNGELLNNSVVNSPSGSKSPIGDDHPLNHSIYDLLNETIVPITFEPPCTDYRQSFVDKYCRLGGVRLTPEGSQTSGWLWEIGEAIVFSARDEKQIASLAEESDDGHSNFENSAMLIILRRLMGIQCVELATTLGQYLAKDARTNDTMTEGYHFFVDKMIEAVLRGMQQQRPLCLVRLVGDPEPRGIFVGTGYMDPAMVFTGFWKEEEKYVSIEVQCQDGTNDRPRRLYPQSWINGVWFAPRGTRKSFVFPYPFAS